MNKLNEFDVLRITGASFVDKKLALYSDKGDEYARYLIRDKDMIIRGIASQVLNRKQQQIIFPWTNDN